MSRALPYLILLFLPTLLPAQADTLVSLPEVSVSALPLRAESTGECVDRIPTQDIPAAPAATVADLLSRLGGVYIHAYGGGGIATASLRGGSSSHTAVVWNGFAIQSPMLGLSDLSLLPLAFVGDVRVHHGASGANWGGGAVGGAIVLGSAPDSLVGSRASVSVAMGSFGRRDLGLVLGHRGARLAAVTRAFHGRADNDFLFTPYPGAASKRQVHAGVSRSGILQELTWRPNARTLVEAHGWWQIHARQVPPTVVQTASGASQDDRILRTTLAWTRTGRHFLHRVRGAFFYERILFRDTLVGIDAPSDFRTLAVEGESRWEPLEGLSAIAGANVLAQDAGAEGYRRRVHDPRQAVFLMVRGHRGPWSAQVQVRQEWRAGQAVPIQPAVGLQWAPLDWLELRTRWARHYRLPSLNDLHWVPGGDPDLRPEDGWSREAGFTLRLGSAWRYECTGYDRTVKDWILWALLPGQPFWSAGNVTRVRSAGVEQRLGGRIDLLGCTFRLELGHDLSHSRNLVALQRPLLPAGVQLPYVPVHQAFGRIRVARGAWELGYDHRHVAGVRGINEDPTPFQVGAADLRATFHRRAATLETFLRVENLWNEDYRVVERRPMPGRHVLIGMTLFLERKTTAP